MLKSIYTVLSNIKIAKNTFQTKLSGDISHITAPGQFVNIQLDGFYLRRPISVCDADDGVLTIIDKTVGHGTEYMSGLPEGHKLDILTGLGNGYDLKKSGSSPLLIGGGAGVPPMYMLCRLLTNEGKKCTVILGFNTADEVFYAEEFKSLGAHVLIATADGSAGTRGFVTDCIPKGGYTHFYTCGPEPMLKAVYSATGNVSGQFSFEERMGCGFGACVGCTCETKYGKKRICRDGPVLIKEEIIW